MIVESHVKLPDVIPGMGKEPTAWLRQIETLEYISFMAQALDFNSVPRTELEETKAIGTSASGA